MVSKVAKLVPHVKENAKDGGVDNVMKAIDSFPYRDSLVILNDEKGTLLDNAVTKFKPRVALELGFSCGCSAIRIALKMTKYDSKLLTLQPREEKTKIARELMKHAGKFDLEPRFNVYVLSTSYI